MSSEKDNSWDAIQDNLKKFLDLANVNPSFLQIQSISYKLLQAALKSPCCGLHR